MSAVDYLVIRLYGPMASWGEIAVGESRHSAVHPSRSALLGLLGAALGIERDDDAGQAALSAGYRFGGKLVSVGMPLRDYHTVQAPPQQRKVTYRTRRQELMDKSRLGTVLSAREYRCDSLCLVAIEALPGARHSLKELAEALKKPIFPLYLGRRSCPLALPVGPSIIKADGLKDALDRPQPSLLALLRTSNSGEASSADWPSREDKFAFKYKSAAQRYFWEQGMEAGMPATLHVTRHDQPVSRRRWQFMPRLESVHLPEEAQA
jgi:CRISPR system Cascade subunit CasD